MSDPVYILIRTSNRPKYFENLMQSIREQTYENIITVVHSDDPSDEYVTGDIIIRSERPPRTLGTAPYNLYNNNLLQAIPDSAGWYHFIDDDDIYASPEVIERLVRESKRECINIARVMRWHGTIWPRKWGNQNSYQTECFFIHTDHKLKASWWANKGGDHNYSGQLTKILPQNWIDNLIIAKAQEGKGHGRRLDLGEYSDLPRTHPNVINPPLPYGQKNQELVFVQYLRTIKTPSSIRGHEGYVTTMEVKRAQRLEFKEKVKILSIAEVNALNLPAEKISEAVQ